MRRCFPPALFRAYAVTKSRGPPAESLKARETKFASHITQKSAICRAGRLLQCRPKVVHAAPRFDLRGLFGNGFPAPGAIEVSQAEPIASEQPGRYAHQCADTA
jgi:hypothetical protein